MKKIIRHTSVLFLLSGLLFACRGGVHKNNDHDYDGKNENNDHINDMNDQASDTIKSDSTQYDGEPDKVEPNNNKNNRS